MEPRSGKRFGLSSAAMAASIALCGAPLPLAAQVAGGTAVDGALKAISGSGSVFTAATHTRTERASGTDTRTEPSVGLSGRLGGKLASGANSLVLQYGGSLETRRDTADGDQTDSSSINGGARYDYFDPAQPLDFNLGHSVSSVRNNTGFVVNPSSYDTRNTLSAGAGLRFYPGSLSTLRFFGQAGQSFGKGDLSEDNSITAGAEFSRRLSERSAGSLNANRSWSDQNEIEQTIDSAQLVYQRELENGSFSIGAGNSWAETEYQDGTVSDSDAITGFLTRNWVADQYSTSLQYNRRMSDQATDLSLNLPPQFGFLPDTVRLRELVVSDSVLISHNTDLLCNACSLHLAAEVALLDSQISGDKNHEYRTSASLGVQLTNLQRITFGYSWQGDAEDDSGTIADQIHRLDARWSRQLAENTDFAVAFSQSYLRSDLGSDDSDQYTIRFELTHGFALTGQR